jgi:tRNA modification GTPase
MNRDTICAISTPAGISGIGIIRLSGSKTYNILNEIFYPSKNKKKIEHYASHTVHYGHIKEKGKVIEEVLVTIMKAPKTYTREDMAEIGCHGGIIPLKKVLDLCLKKGAILAGPGEFTQRAFLNGRIDLTQAESVMEIINSKTTKSMEIAINKLQGHFSKNLCSLRKSIINLLSILEAKINFPEEQDIKNFSIDTEKKLRNIKAEIEAILKSSERGKITYQGVNAAIIGKPNAGKSSLLNLLIKEDRAIVTDIPGTTRDTLHETVSIKGIPVKIIDTAGIRKFRNKIEEMGVKKAVEWMEKAEITMLVLDGGKKLNVYDRNLMEKIKGKNYLIIINKSDLPLKIESQKIEKKFPADKIIKISAKTGEGIEQLEEAIYDMVMEGFGEMEEKDIYLNIREEQKIQTIKSFINDCLNIPENQPEITAEILTRSIKEIDGVTGKNITGETLENIFSQFCIGK